MLRQLRDGWNEFSSRSWLWIIVVQFGLFRMLVYGPSSYSALRWPIDSLGLHCVGLDTECAGGGSIVGGLTMQRIRPHRPLLVATLATFALPLQ